jgi:hypothetical protein
MPNKNTTYFNDQWLSDERFADWIKKASNTSAKCCKCCKLVDLSSMGVSALISHAAGKKHQKAVTACNASVTLSTFLAPSKTPVGTISPEEKNESGSCTADKGKNTATSSRSATLDHYVLQNAVTNAEILWALKVVLSKASLRSCEELKCLFQAMFSDSKIAERFQLGKTKCGYYVTYGIAPHFQDLLIKGLKTSPCYSVSFDESLNRIFQLEQMDMNIRYWDEKEGLVKVNYFTSRFFERPNAENILNELRTALKPVPEQRMIQLSMDGPNTNWKVLELLQKHREGEEWPSLLNLGCCSLHVVHGAFQTGVKKTDWELDKILRAMFKIFNDSPARREMYTRIGETDVFPLRFDILYFFFSFDA